jgi:hypothetical protein
VLRPGTQAAVIDKRGQLTIWLPHAGSTETTVALDLGAVQETTGRTMIIEEVSADRSGAVVEITEVPRSGRNTLTQPAESVWRVTICPSVDPQPVRPSVAVSVSQSATSKTVTVRRDPQADSWVGYLGFDRPRHGARVAILDAQGQTNDARPMTFRVYGLPGAKLTSELTWATAPQLDQDQLRIRTENEGVLPLGLITVGGAGEAARLDVTKIIDRTDRQPFVLILIRERGLPDDDADDGRTAVLENVRLVSWL